MKISERLSTIGKILDSGLGADGTCEVLELLGAAGLSSDILSELRLYSECLPTVDEVGYTAPQRYMHFLWDALDKLPISIVVDFSIQFRRMLAKRLFARCGRNFIAEENVRFNFPQNLEVGLTPKSPILAPCNREPDHITTHAVGRMIRTAIKNAKLECRPYKLRSYFETRMEQAEKDGVILKDWRKHWAGHVGDTDARYTHGKGK